MIKELHKISRQCDGVRCDMEMLVLPDVFDRTWGRRPELFWPKATKKVREQSPDFCFMAEVYWDMEWAMQQQGFDYAYDKRLYDRLREGHARPVREHLHAVLDYQAKPARFLENHDEPRASASFEPTLRERIDLIGTSANEIIKQASAEMIRKKALAISPIQTSAGSFIPLDMDVSPFDNSKTKKEDVSRTYKGCDGYAPMLGYLGTEGYLINVELRKGSQHCQKDTPAFIEEILKVTRQITQEPLLIRLDSGNDSQDNFEVIMEWDDVDVIVKRNLRKEF